MGSVHIYEVGADAFFRRGLGLRSPAAALQNYCIGQHKNVTRKMQVQKRKTHRKK